MTGKELVIAALQNREVPRVPWVPFVGCHGAHLLGVSAEEYFRSAELTVQGLKKAAELYRPDGLPALFDLQVEAEALGCGLRYAPDNPPSVVEHILASDPDIGKLRLPSEDDGRFPIVLEALSRVVDELGDRIAIYGLVTGPFTLALHLRGTDIFFDLIDQPEYVHSLMEFTTAVASRTAAMYMSRGVDVIALVDPMTSQISPDVFKQFVAPYATRLFGQIRKKSCLSSFFVCGNAKANIEAMSECGPDNISIDENIPLDYVRDICRPKGISFGGNIKLTMSILFGTVEENLQDAMNCLHIGGKQGYLLAPGCDLPFDSPQENLQAIAALAHGDVTSSAVGTVGSLEGVEVEVPDYAGEQVIVDVFTLDSASCAPCQYMVAAVQRSAEQFGDRVVWQEWKIKQKKSVALMQKLGVTNIPTTAIDGEVKFISRIPDDHSLRQEIAQALAKKQKN